MKKYLNISSLALLLAITLMAGKCSKETTPLISDQLPPATQTGANTFGCLINGKVWLPKGADFQLPNMLATVDPTLGDGDLSIRVYRIEGGEKTRMAFLSGSIKAVGSNEIGTRKKTLFVFDKSKIDNSVKLCEAENSEGGVILIMCRAFLKSLNMIYKIEFSQANLRFRLTIPNAAWATP